MPVAILQIVFGLIILWAAKVLTQGKPESYGHGKIFGSEQGGYNIVAECQDDENDWMKGSQGPPWFSVKCEQGEAMACGFDMAKEKPDKSLNTICPGEYYEPKERKELFTCTYPTDAGSTSKRTLIVRHYSLDNDMKYIAKAIEEMRLDKLKAKAALEYTAWKQKHDEWMKKHEIWQREYEKLKPKHDQWQAGYKKWKQEQAKEAEKFTAKVGQILKTSKAPVYGETEPAKPRREPVEPESPVEKLSPGSWNWMTLRQPLLKELGVQPSLGGKCASAE